MNIQELIECYERVLNFVPQDEQRIYRKFVEKLKELDEPQKPVVPQFVADWIEYCKGEGLTLLGSLDPIDKFGNSLANSFKDDVKVCISWARRNSDVFARAWLDGYEVEKEKQYLVKVKGHIHENILVYGYGVKRYFFSSSLEGNKRAKHTRKELEDAGFGDVFDSPLFEVEAVEGEI